MKKICLLLLMISLLAGCTASSYNKQKSYVVNDFPVASLRLVADDLATALVGIYPPGQTRIYLNSAGGDALTPILEASLRARGFSVVPEPDSQAKKLTYILDALDDGGWYLRANLADGYSYLNLTRAYELGKQGLVPAGALSRAGK